LALTTASMMRIEEEPPGEVAFDSEGRGYLKPKEEIKKKVKK